MKIQRATAKHIPDIVPLVEEYWRFEAIVDFNPQRIRMQIERVLLEPALGAVWIAEKNANLIGYLIMVYVFSLEHYGTTAEIDELFVLSSEREKGVGVQLLNIAESEAVQVGCTNVSLQLSKNNGKAREFYRRQGYTERSSYELLEKELV